MIKCISFLMQQNFKKKKKTTLSKSPEYEMWK